MKDTYLKACVVDGKIVVAVMGNVTDIIALLGVLIYKISKESQLSCEKVVFLLKQMLDLDHEGLAKFLENDDIM